MVMKGSKIKSLKRRYCSSRYVIRELKQRRRRRQRQQERQKSNWFRISAIKFEAAQLHFLSDVFVAVAVGVVVT